MISMQKNTVANTDLSNNTIMIIQADSGPENAFFCIFTALNCVSLHKAVVLCISLYCSLHQACISLQFTAPTLHCSWWIAEICSRRRNVTKCPMRGCTGRSCHLAGMIFIINYLGQGHPDFFYIIMIVIILMIMKIIVIQSWS